MGNYCHPSYTEMFPFSLSLHSGVVQAPLMACIHSGAHTCITALLVGSSSSFIMAISRQHKLHDEIISQRT